MASITPGFPYHWVKEKWQSSHVLQHGPGQFAHMRLHMRVEKTATGKWQVSGCPVATPASGSPCEPIPLPPSCKLEFRRLVDAHRWAEIIVQGYGLDFDQVEDSDLRAFLTDTQTVPSYGTLQKCLEVTLKAAVALDDDAATPKTVAEERCDLAVQADRACLRNNTEDCVLSHALLRLYWGSEKSLQPV